MIPAREASRVPSTSPAGERRREHGGEANEEDDER